METGFGWGGSVEDVAAIAAELETGGVHVRVRTDHSASVWGELEPARGAEPDAPTASLEYRNRDARVVEQKLREHGIRPPELH